MRIVALDSSSSVGSVAVLEDREIRFFEEFESPRGRGGALFPALQRAMACGGPSRIAAGIGPGSYNGLRVAIAAAIGIARATGADLVGVPSILALPLSGVDEYVAIGDARGSSFYFAHIVQRDFVEGPMLAGAAEISTRLAGFANVPVFAPARIPDMPSVIVAHPNAAIIAQLGAALPAQQQPPEPIYLKQVRITRPTPFAFRVSRDY